MMKHQNKAHKPGIPMGLCQVCDEVRVLNNQEEQPKVGGRVDEIEAQADLIELGEPDINGHMYIMTMTTDRGIKAGAGSKTKSEKDCMKTMTEVVDKISLRALYPHGVIIKPGGNTF